MYLFFFAILYIIFQYANEKVIFGAQEEKIEKLSQKLQENKATIDSLQNRVADLDYFTLQGNENAITYLENYGLDAVKVQEQVSNTIYDQNGTETGNPLVPFENDFGAMRINKIKFLNHRWIQADFSNGSKWGELLLEYQFDENNELSIYPLGSMLYPTR